MIERLLFRCRRERNAYRDFVESIASGELSWENCDVAARHFLSEMASEYGDASEGMDNAEVCESGTESVGWACGWCGRYLGAFTWPARPEGKLCECATTRPRPLLRPVS